MSPPRRLARDFIRWAGTWTGLLVVSGGAGCAGPVPPSVEASAVSATATPLPTAAMAGPSVHAYIAYIAGSETPTPTPTPRPTQTPTRTAGPPATQRPTSSPRPRPSGTAYPPATALLPATALPPVLVDSFRGAGPLGSHVPDVSPGRQPWRVVAGRWLDIADGFLGYNSGSYGLASIDLGLSNVEVIARLRTGPFGPFCAGLATRCNADGRQRITFTPSAVTSLNLPWVRIGPCDGFSQQSRAVVGNYLVPEKPPLVSVEIL